ncbi:hypothetical protein [uncultured Psychroserpens sp.]|uniref:hypothetical protein n=1 Tax=uncultured Psychroserpens sp. TaxID=255436 RepID=UPI002608D2F1|nr:hypothetical protein [uncultured Psychroserpens sp.]
MKNYTSFEEIDYDLKRLDLERQIAFEELKGIKSDVKDDLRPIHWLQTVAKYVTKYGSLLLLKKIVK